MKRLAIAGLAVLGLAAPASAATVLVESDKAIYSFGETIIITTILTVDGDEAPVPAINLQLVWDGSVASPGPSPSTILPVITSFTGLFPWNKGLGNCPPAGGSCLTLDYLSPTAPTPQTPDPGVYVSTLALIAGSKVGSLNVAISAATPTVLGAVPKLGANLQSGFIPEPGTAALLGLGLLGLGLRSRRRA